MHHALNVDGAAGAMLEEAGRTYGAASAPSSGWDGITLREAGRRLLSSLDAEGDDRRDGQCVELITVRCALPDATEEDRRAALCEAVCGERTSLLHGLAVAAGAGIESPDRMGAGAPRCVRRLRLPPESR